MTMIDVDSFRAKWLMDGATTLSEAAQLLRAEADRLQQLEEEGWQLTEPIADDYGFIAVKEAASP